MASVEALAPYQPNAQGLTEVLIDLKSTMPSQTVLRLLDMRLRVLKMSLRVMQFMQGQVMASW